MSLLVLEGVTTHPRGTSRARALLRGVTLHVDPGELVSIWGVERSERTMLARIAAGLERPDEGTVRLDGLDLAQSVHEAQRGCLRFVQPYSAAAAGKSVMSYVALPLFARRMAPHDAEAKAAEALYRVGARELEGFNVDDLDSAEFARVAIAQALVTEPRIIVADDPTRDVDVLARASVLRLLRRIADGGVAVLMTTGEARGVAGADRALTIGGGVLRFEDVAPVADVIALPRRDVQAGSST